MKKIVFLVFISVLSINAFAQSKSYEELRKESERYQENTSTLYVQIVGDEQINGAAVKLRLVVGVNKQFFVKNKNDFDAFEQLEGEIQALSTIPDALDFLNERGFELKEYSTVLFQDMIRHNIILSKVSFQ
jgi:hypothetical protein